MEYYGTKASCVGGHWIIVKSKFHGSELLRLNRAGVSVGSALVLIGSLPSSDICSDKYEWMCTALSAEWTDKQNQTEQNKDDRLRKQYFHRKFTWILWSTNTQYSGNFFQNDFSTFLFQWEVRFWKWLCNKWGLHSAYRLTFCNFLIDWMILLRNCFVIS